MQKEAILAGELVRGTSARPFEIYLTERKIYPKGLNNLGDYLRRLSVVL